MSPISSCTLMEKTKDKKFLRMQMAQHTRINSTKDAARVFIAGRNTVGEKEIILDIDSSKSPVVIVQPFREKSLHVHEKKRKKLKSLTA